MSTRACRSRSGSAVCCGTAARNRERRSPRVTVLATLVVVGTCIGPVPGVALAVLAAVALRVPRARPLLTIGSPALLLVSAGYIVAKQVHNRLPAGFDWPTYFESVHQVAWTAVALLLLDVVLDRVWSRRWWPTEDSPA